MLFADCRRCSGLRYYPGILRAISYSASFRLFRVGRGDVATDDLNNGFEGNGHFTAVTNARILMRSDRKIVGIVSKKTGAASVGN